MSFRHTRDGGGGDSVGCTVSGRTQTLSSWMRDVMPPGEGVYKGKATSVEFACYTVFVRICDL